MSLCLWSETHGTCALETLQPVFREILDCSINAIDYDALSSTVCSSTMSSTYGYDLLGSTHTGHGDLSSEQINCLRNIGEGLNCTGCLGDFIEAYRYSRKSAVDARCRRFCISKWTSNDLQNLDCEEFTTEIKIWIQTAKICYNSIFPREKQYIEQIFGGVRAVTHDNFFVAIVEHVAIELNNFAEAVSSIASFRKLFDVLDMYKALFVILPNIQTMFRSISCTNISHEATTTFYSLANVVRKLFSSFEDTVLYELSNTLPPEGTIHSLTEYAMNYVTSISQYKEILTNIIISRPSKSLGNQAHELFFQGSGGTPLGLHMIWIIMSLRINLEGKSSLYKDTSLSLAFNMNNADYILKSITGSPELQEMIGKEYLSMLHNDVAQAKRDYSSSIWHRVLYCLRDDGLNYKFPFYTGILKNSVKKRFKTFNTEFEEICQAQIWKSVPDIDIHRHLRELILRKLLPAYRSFLGKYGGHLQSVRYRERYIKYSIKELADKLKFCFQCAADYQISFSTGRIWMEFD
ncbi:hypothetical protein POM88_033987 [Heracleum sosnowskyi]|uniref:Exocyst subunit Exo70 family protein n=1 Tax=Heracleum sosnowskyi TaxID=360622 RepID=A0AAD8HIF0_9APIA|nr:hypothetical protein POM88_033987 [Heracleum sosnowskyi]